MALRRTNSRLDLPSSSSPLMSSSTTTLPLPSHFFLSVSPRKPKHRTIYFALFVLIGLSTYIFFVARPALAFSQLTLRANSGSINGGGGSGRRLQIVFDTEELKQLPHSRVFRLPADYQSKLKASNAERPQVQLNESQELAAVSSFLASLPQNVIPPSVDPSRPIDPELVLDFDTRGPRAADGVQEIVEDVWTRNPVILFSKLHSSRSREIKTILDEMNLSPPPTIFDVDQRADAEVLTPLLFRLTSSTELPILLVGGKPVTTTSSEINALLLSGELHRIIAEAGAVHDGWRRKRKGRK